MGSLDGLTGDVSGLKVAFSADLGHARVDGEVAELVANAVKGFADTGVTLESPRHLARRVEIIRYFWAAHELELAVHLETHREQMDPGLVACIESVTESTASEYVRQRGRKPDYIAAIHAFFDRGTCCSPRPSLCRLFLPTDFNLSIGRNIHGTG